jgi:hypothetical protein
MPAQRSISNLLDINGSFHAKSQYFAWFCSVAHLPFDQSRPPRMRGLDVQSTLNPQNSIRYKQDFHSSWESKWPNPKICHWLVASFQLRAPCFERSENRRHKYSNCLHCLKTFTSASSWKVRMSIQFTSVPPQLTVLKRIPILDCWRKRPGPVPRGVNDKLSKFPKVYPLRPQSLCKYGSGGFLYFHKPF